MQRIHAADTVPVLPEAPKDGTPGYFSDGNAATGDMATVIDAAWCNGVQEELMAFLAAAGVEPSAEDLGQVLASVKKLTDDAIKKYAAPVEHADDEPTYGQGNASSYGHVKLSDATNADELDAGGGTAASPKAVAEVMSVASGAAKAASNAQISADGAQNSANEAQTSADNAQESAEAAAQLARATGSIVVATGETDYVSDGDVTYRLENGTGMLGNVSGTGCMLSSVMGCYIGAFGRNLDAVASAVTVFNVAAEAASGRCGGPGTFKPALMDALFALDGQTVDAAARCERL